VKIVLATHNPHKREELESVLRDALPERIEVLTLDDLPQNVGEIEETGATLKENAAIKAHAVFNASGLPSLADDTGLEVRALGGAPGVYSARYAGPGASYEDNVRKLLGELRHATDRSARFVTAICFVDAHGVEHSFEGSVEGVITEARFGTAGFGYDPVFAPADADGKTFAEMTGKEKNAISHRGRALRAFADWLRDSGH
jgi:XTP/dITP diphosphohydrolase